MFRRKMLSSNSLLFQKIVCVCALFTRVQICALMYIDMGMRRLEENVGSSGVFHYCFLSYSFEAKSLMELGVCQFLARLGTSKPQQSS